MTFDLAKEHVIIMHPIQGEGDPFKLLGCMMDCKLWMQHATNTIIAQMRPKVTAILRTRFHYDGKSLMSKFKTHMWGIMEIHTGAIFHASNYLLDRLDEIQRKFIHESSMDESVIFL